MYTVSGVSRISNGRGRVKIRAGPGGKQLLSGSRSSRPFARASAMPCRLALYLSIPSERNGGTLLPKPKNGTPPGSSAKLPKRSLTARRFQIPERSAFAVPDREALWASKPEVTASAAIPTTIEPMKPVRIWKLLLRRHTDTRTRIHRRVSQTSRALSIWSSVSRLIGPFGEHGGVAACELKDTQDLAAVFEGGPGNLDHVPELQGILVPAKAEQRRRTRRFGNPVRDVTVLVLHVKMNLRMGIRKDELGHRPLQSYRMVPVVQRPGVVRQQRARNQQNQNARPQNSE